MMLDILAGIGGTVIETSLNRIDYAIDIRADCFVLEPHRFIAHPKTELHSRWSRKDEHQPAVVLAGRKVESVTIGKMPGKQIILYDKTAEARENRALYWFEAWGIDPRNPDARVWRLELRLGRNALKRDWRIKCFDDLRKRLRPALLSLMGRTRYIRAGEVDLNVSRRRTDPIWDMAIQHIEEADLLGDTGQLPAARLLEITQAMMIECHEKLIFGNTAALAAVMDLDDQTIEDRLPQLLAEKLRGAVSTQSFRRSVVRARRRRDVILPRTKTE
jgi:hypothetical protein